MTKLHKEGMKKVLGGAKPPQQEIDCAIYAKPPQQEIDCACQEEHVDFDGKGTDN